MNLRKITQAIKNNDVNFWQSVTDEELNVARSKAQSNWLLKYENQLYVFIGFASLFLALYSVLGDTPLQKIWSNDPAGVVLFHLFLVVASIALITVVFGLLGILLFEGFKNFAFYWTGDPSLVADKLKPLAEKNQLCSIALQFLEVSECKAYRDAVIGKGRELLVADYDNLYDINARVSYEAHERAKQEQYKIDCQKLHGLL